MFAYILRANNVQQNVQQNEQTDEFFRRFMQMPGLLHAYDLQNSDDASDTLMVAIWESREAAERYLNSDPLRKEVDQTIPGVTRTMYEVLGGK